MNHDIAWRTAAGTRLSRRRLVTGAASLGFVAAATGIVGCSSKSVPNGTKPTAIAPGQGRAIAPTPAGAVAAGTPAPGAGSPAPAAVDLSKGKSGGTFIFVDNAFTSYALLTAQVGMFRVAGFVHSALLQFAFGHPPSNGLDVVPETELAQAFPEQPDELTMVYTLHPGVKFHNGRDLTSQDVAYTFDAYAHGDKSGQSVRAPSWQWYDHTETPDPLTAIIKTKTPYADAVLSCCGGRDAHIMAKEFQEGPDVIRKLMGSGPFMFDNDSMPISASFKKNPNYFMKPYPYFDTIIAQGAPDPAKQVADFVSKQVQLTITQPPVQYDAIKQQRPDAKFWEYLAVPSAVLGRCDQPPFNDKRVRQALSMGIDRKNIRDTVYDGLGADDQILSPLLGSTWGFRKPSDLGAAAKYWNYDPQAAKQLLAAAGFDKPIENTFSHMDATSSGQAFVDVCTLMEARWKQDGIANFKDISLTPAQNSMGLAVGNFTGLGYTVPSYQQPVFGLELKTVFWSPPEGVTVPTLNLGHVNDPQLNALIDKELSQLNRNDRIQTFHQMEDLLAEQQYRIPTTSNPIDYASDPNLRNCVVPKWTYASPDHYFKYWYFA